MNFFSDKSSLKSAALDYAERGFPVYPLAAVVNEDSIQPRAKKIPLTVHGHLDASVDLATIEDWWNKFPEALIGLPTGCVSGLFVIDVDSEEANNNWLTFASENGFDPKETAWEKTPRGYHYVYRYPETGRRPTLSSDLICKGVETKGEGGNIVVSPSCYTIDGISGSLQYVPLGNKEIADLPDVLYDIVQTLPAYEDRKVSKKSEGARETKSAEKTSESGYRVLEEVCKKLSTAPEGIRNKLLYSQSVLVGKYVASGQILEEEAREKLTLTALQSGLEERETMNAITNGLNAGKRQYGATAQFIKRNGQNKGTESGDENEEESQILFRLPDLPLEALPKAAERIVRNIAYVHNTDPWIPFAAILKCVAALVGANYLMRFGPYLTPAHQWLMLVCSPGSKKTTVTKIIFAPVKNLQSIFDSEGQLAMEVYEDDLAKWEKNKRDAQKKDQDAVHLGPKPRPPVVQYVYVNNITIEKLVEVFVDNPGGVVWDNDEIATWIRGFNKYSRQNEGADKSQALSMYEGGEIRVQRIKHGKAVLNVPQAWLSVYGTVQPDILPTLISEEDFNSGFMQRFLFVCPDETPPSNVCYEKIRDDDIHALFQSMMAWPRLSALHRTADGGCAVDEAPIIEMAPEASALLDQYIFNMEYNAFYLSTGDAPHRRRERSRVKRAGEHVSRLVFALHCLESSADGEMRPRKTVTLQTVQNALCIYDALVEHNKYAWAKIEEKVFQTTPEKKYIQFSETAILPFIDDMLVEDKRGAFVSFIYARKIKNAEGKEISCFDEFVNRLTTGRECDTKITRRALSARLVELGFTERRVQEGTSYMIKKKKYLELKEQMAK